MPSSEDEERRQDAPGDVGGLSMSAMQTISITYSHEGHIGGASNVQPESQDGEEDYVKEFIESLPKSQQECVKALEILHLEIEKLETTFRKDQRDLERKCESLKAPCFDRRARIISGEDEAGETVGQEAIGIPSFWLQAMRNCASVRENITDKDEVVLRYLTHLASNTLPEEEGVGFRLDFFFAPNEFFSNTELSKTYIMADSDYHEVIQAKGTVIDWKEGRNVTVRTTKKKQRKKNSSDTRTVVKTEPCESFFNFFSPPEIPAYAREHIDDEELDIREEELEADHEVGLSFHEHLVPRAIQWFTGQGDGSEADDDSSSEVSGGSAMDEDPPSPGSSGGSDDSAESQSDDDDDDDDDFSPVQARASKADATDAFVAGLPEGMQRRVRALLALDGECEAVQAQFRRDERDLDRRYEQLKAPIYAARARVVAGELPPAVVAAEAAAAAAAAAAATAAGGPSAADSSAVVVAAADGRESTADGRESAAAAAASAASADASAETAPLAASAASAAAAAAAEGGGIPGFWLEAMRNCARVGRRVTERDEEALRHLRDVRCATLPEADGPGFRLEFAFGPNEFFADGVLAKTFFLADSEYLDPVRATGTAVQWREGRNLTVRITRRRRRCRAGGRGLRPVVREEPCDSFFNFFRDTVPPPPRGGGGGGGGGGEEDSADEEENDDEDGEGGEDSDGGGEDDEEEEDERERLEVELDGDLDVGTSFREHLVPHAVRWFTGEADDDSDDGDDDDEDEADGGDE